MTEFYVGQKVLCVNAGPIQGSIGSGYYLFEKEVYTVVDVFPSREASLLVSGKFKGVFKGPLACYKERFIPLVTEDSFETDGIE